MLNLLNNTKSSKTFSSFPLQKIFLVCKVCLYLGFFMGLESQANGFETYTAWSFDASYNLSPSGVRNKNVYELNLLELVMKKNITELLPEAQRDNYSDSFQLRMEYVPISSIKNQNLIVNPSASSGGSTQLLAYANSRMLLQVSEVYFDDREILSLKNSDKNQVAESRQLRIGYFISPWIELERAYWSGYLLGDQSAALWEHSGYNHYTEVGIDYGTLLNVNHTFNMDKKFLLPQFQWKFGVVSADGVSGQPMYQKDFYGLLQWSDEYFFGVGAQVGWYAGLPTTANQKNRSFYWFGLQSKEFSWMLQGYESVDAVDGITTRVADGADFTDVPGTVVYGQGVGLCFSENFSGFENDKSNEGFQLSLRQDYMNPDKKRTKKSEWSTQASVKFPWRIGQIVFSVAQLKFDDNHGLNPSPMIYSKLGYVGTF